MGFNVKKALREKIFVKVALMAPSGGGKTYSALRLATGMAEEIEKKQNKEVKILLANTEQKRGYYYANEFNYDIVDIEAPHNPEKYVELIEFAEEEGYDILILDSSSHEWEGKGGCLELQQQAGGTYQAWGKITPRHNKFIEAIADSKLHMIVTMRGKDQYEMEKDNNGKTSVKKLGVGAKQRDGFEYEFTCTFLLDQKTNTADVQKDNTHIFENEGSILLTENHGKKLIQWSDSGEGYTPPVRKTNKEIPEPKTVKEVTAEISSLAKEKAKELGKDVVLDLLGKYHESKNPGKITDLKVAENCLAELKNLKAEVE